jgi:hypothetical protein
LMPEAAGTTSFWIVATNASGQWAVPSTMHVPYDER